MEQQPFPLSDDELKTLRMMAERHQDNFEIPESTAAILQKLGLVTAWNTHPPGGFASHEEFWKSKPVRVYVITMAGIAAARSTVSSGRKPDANRTQKKNSQKNLRPWDTNCKRMAKAYIRQCVKDGREVARGAFIEDELRKNGTNYPNAKSAATIDKAFQLNPDEWKPALSEALSRPDADRTH